MHTLYMRSFKNIKTDMINNIYDKIQSYNMHKSLAGEYVNSSILK